VTDLSELKIEHAIVMFLNGMSDGGRIIEETFCGERGFRVIRPPSSKHHQKESAWSPVNSVLRMVSSSAEGVDAWWINTLTQEARMKLLPPSMGGPHLLGLPTKQ
jgi:hypothetical protein